MVAQESILSGVDTSRSRSNAVGSGPVLRAVGHLVAVSVEANSKDQFLWRGAMRQPVINGLGNLGQGSVQTQVAIEGHVEVVGHDVDKGQMLGDGRDVVGDASRLLGGTHSDSQFQTILIEAVEDMNLLFHIQNLIILMNSRFLDFAQKGHKVFTVSLAASALSRVLPVQIQTVEAVLLNKGQGRGDEGGALGRISSHGGVLGGALVPATHDCQDLQIRIALLQGNGLADEC